MPGHFVPSLRSNNSGRDREINRSAQGRKVCISIFNKMGKMRGAFISTSLLLLLLAQGFAQDNSTNATTFQVDLSMLGDPTWSRLRPGWSLTVNDQCLYEFIFQFEHDENLPIGRRNFEEECAFKDPETKKPLETDDGLPFLDPRRMWERFPRYVWETIGFNHLSIDWYPCGHRPRGYAIAQYSFAFHRVTPEFRALAMTCDLHSDQQVIVPGEQVCSFEQDTVNGRNFYILPASIVDTDLIVNMPTTFARPELGNGPVPHVGLRSWDQDVVPATPNRWEDTPIFMATYAGDLVMWEAHAPYKRLSGEEKVFTSNTHRYHEPTVEGLPDTHAFHWDEDDGFIRFHMIGKAGLCRPEFEAAQEAAGGAPVFPNWDDVFGTGDSVNNGNGNGNGNGDGNENGNGNGEGSGSAHRGFFAFVSTFALLLWTSL